MVDRTVKILVGIPTSGTLRNSVFIDYYHQILKPEGTAITFVHGASPARGRNDIIKAALAQNFTHVMFLDDDTVPPPDVISRLLYHDKDIVGGLYLMRSYPHFPLMFDLALADGRCRYKFLTDKLNGLVEVENMGFGCCLIKTEVFKIMKEKGFADPWVTLGEYEKDHWCDDLSFFNRAKLAGFKIFVDLDIRVGHFANVILRPVFDDKTGKWMTGLNLGGNDMVYVPQVIPDMSVIGGADGEVRDNQPISG